MVSIEWIVNFLCKAILQAQYGILSIVPLSLEFILY